MSAALEGMRKHMGGLATSLTNPTRSELTSAREICRPLVDASTSDKNMRNYIDLDEPHRLAKFNLDRNYLQNPKTSIPRLTKYNTVLASHSNKYLCENRSSAIRAVEGKPTI